MVDRISRRLIVALIGSMTVAWPFAAQAQPRKLYRVGFGHLAAGSEFIEPFRDGLRAHGYEEGRNLQIDYRWAEGNYERFPKLIAELLALHVDVIVTAGTPSALAVKRATTSVPLVMIAVGDPIGTGIVPSLARPGGNITGLSSIAPELEGKRLELLREIIPKLSHVAVLTQSGQSLSQGCAATGARRSSRAAYQDLAARNRSHRRPRWCVRDHRQGKARSAADSCGSHLSAQSRAVDGIRDQEPIAECECLS